jgi:hypothetical protein
MVNHMWSLVASACFSAPRLPVSFYPSGISESLNARTVFLRLLFSYCLSTFTSDAKSELPLASASACL